MLADARDDADRHFPAQHGVKYTLEENMADDEFPQVELPQNFKNIGTVMAAAGYNVVYKGKWHLSKPAGTDWAQSDVDKYGFTRWSPRTPAPTRTSTRRAAGMPRQRRQVHEPDGIPTGGAGEGALQYLKSAAAQQQPFFLHPVSRINPHDVLLYPKNYRKGGLRQLRG